MKLKVAFVFLIIALVAYPWILISRFGLAAYWPMMIGTLIIGVTLAITTWKLFLEWWSDRVGRRMEDELATYFARQAAKAGGMHIVAHFQGGHSVSNRP